MTPDQIEGLQSDVRANALVGHYFRSFAILEHQINSAIATALRLSPEQRIIVVANMDFSSKLYALRTIISLVWYSDPAKVQGGTKLYKALNEVSRSRNMIAHTPFGSTDNDSAVQFYIQQARGTLKAETEVWDTEKFFSAFKTLDSLSTDVRLLEHGFQKEDLRQALTRVPPPDSGGPSLSDLFNPRRRGFFG